MKRDWKLIKAILCCQDLSAWDEATCNHHFEILADRGWLIAETLSGVPMSLFRKSSEVHDIAAKL